MKIIYIDSDGICHAHDGEGRTPIETDAMDFVADVALPCYRVRVTDGEITAIQCINTAAADEATASTREMDECLAIIEGRISYDEG